MIAKDEKISRLESEKQLVCASFPQACKILGVKPKRYFGPRNRHLNDDEADRTILLATTSPKASVGINLDRARALLSRCMKSNERQGKLRLLYALADIRRATRVKHLVSLAHEQSSDSTF